jgi:polyhydroxybutyrate depolymerase
MLRVSKISFVLLLGLFLVTGCSKDDSPKVDEKFSINGSITHDGKTRTFILHLPPDYYTGHDKLPLLLGLHGGGGSATNFRGQTDLDLKADKENFIIVYPDGLENPGSLQAKTWNAGYCCGPNSSVLNTDDVGFISSLIDYLSVQYRVDTKRVYATGHSNGAMMSYRLANELSQKIAAIAPNAGNFQMKNDYHPTRNVPVIHINSKLDQNVQYEGGQSTGPGGQYNPPVDSCLNVIAALASCGTSKELVETHALYSVYRWSNCSPSDFVVMLYLTEDGGHSWPGGNITHADADPPSQAFKNNDVMWSFLKNYSLP